MLGRIGKAEAGIQGTTTTIAGIGYGLAGAHPVPTAAAIAAADVYSYRNRSRFSSDSRAKLARFGTEAFKILSKPFVQHEVHGRDWAQAQRGTAGDDVLSLVARLLAHAPEPMTRTDILAALPASVQVPHRRQLDRLGLLLHRFPAFHQAVPGRWQLGRSNMQIIAQPRA
ncbi:hypothetical protein [Streptomyces avermitilis]|uniref:hypothetical protein n=1 Tax=Streptomyces avermitilis TaxID=33903 RepID=UPI003720901D